MDENFSLPEHGELLQSYSERVESTIQRYNERNNLGISEFLAGVNGL